jgi:hypothetical protein
MNRYLLYTLSHTKLEKKAPHQNLWINLWPSCVAVAVIHLPLLTNFRDEMSLGY